MDEQDYEKQFEALTDGMKTEKLYDALAERANLVRVIAMHAASVYKTARRAGLPRKVAAAMARDYFDYETTPTSYYLVGKGEG
ncbi:hypothetical protein OIE82_27325 [Streptomyces althioticus]|uniref:Uncharacterized protein n=1 Tax=Streptomyces althioticus TaxID=83380 RepID=A0ABZ1YE74_9ACTN